LSGLGPVGAGGRWVAREREGVILWQVDRWAARGIVHGVTARLGGVSEPPYDSLNLGLHVGDDPACVIENRRRLCRALAVPPTALVAGAQVHGAEVAVITAADMGRGALAAADAVPGVDALVTRDPGPVLFGLFADCVPVLIVDPLTPAVALIHAGWRGTAHEIVARAIRTMTDEFGTRAEACEAAIGPCIGPCCYEVGEDVASRFSGWLKPALAERGGRLYLDLRAANRSLLQAAGLPADNIWLAELCTRCHMDMFFSHRGGAGRTGRMAAVIGL